MQSWKDVAAAVTAASLLALGCVYAATLHQDVEWIDRPEMPARFVPACDYYPNGINGVPCSK